MPGPDTFTRWGAVAAGEGGGRIASQFFVRSDNPGIDDRILVLNTNRADIRNTISRIADHADGDEEEIGQRYAMDFGSEAGAGNRPETGERCAQEDLEEIAERVEARFEPNADAFLHVATLGGGTGNGSIPYLIEQLRDGVDAVDARWMSSATHTAFVVWPFYYEAPQRHFNAITGLSRLLRTADGAQNADMVILAANSHVAEQAGAGDDYGKVNEWIIDAIDLMIGAGRETRGVIDVQDYVAVPSEIGAYHFTPGVATGIDGSVYKLEPMFDRAAESTFVPLDVGTSRAAFAVVRAPEGMIERGEITEPEVKAAFNEWKMDNGLVGAAGMTTLTPKRERGSDVDVLLMLGGFDLDPLLDHSWDAYEGYKQNVQSGRSIDGGGAGDDRLARIEENLKEYLEINAGG